MKQFKIKMIIAGLFMFALVGCSQNSEQSNIDKPSLSTVSHIDTTTKKRKSYTPKGVENIHDISNNPEIMKNLNNGVYKGWTAISVDPIPGDFVGHVKNTVERCGYSDNLDINSDEFLQSSLCMESEDLKNIHFSNGVCLLPQFQDNDTCITIMYEDN